MRYFLADGCFSNCSRKNFCTNLWMRFIFSFSSFQSSYLCGSIWYFAKSIFACLANSLAASQKSILSISCMKVMTFPPFPHPKHLNICLLGETINDGVFSLWKGQHAVKFAPALLRGTYLPTRSTMSTVDKISSASLLKVFYDYQ